MIKIYKICYNFAVRHAGSAERRQTQVNGREIRNMLEKSKWISCKKEFEAPIVKRKFNAEKASSAKIAVCGLGFFELSINGRKVSDDLLVPAQSDYRRRAFDCITYPMQGSFHHRIYYLEYDITEFIRPKENSLEIFLGNGWYRQTERIAEGRLSFGDSLLCIYEIEISLADGGREYVRSDGSETCEPSYITSSNLFLGETHDFRRLVNDGERESVQVISLEGVELSKQTCPADRVTGRLTPKLLSDNGRSRIYDAGENISGVVSFFMDGEPSERATVRFAEELKEDGSLDFASAGGGYVCAGGERQIQRDIFISDGTKRRCAPKFVWHAFRFFEISSDAKISDITVEKIHSDIPVTSSFDCDNEAANWLYEAYIRTQLCNMHAGVPSDCPHRERLGYTGDGQVTSLSCMMLTDSREFYKKWITDIMDCQDPDSGHVRHTAPFMGGGGGPGGWGGAVVIVPYRFWRMYSDNELIKDCYPHMKSWISYMRSRMEDGLVVREEEGGWCLGDWASIGEMLLPEPYFNTCYYIKALKYMLEMADAIGAGGEAALLRAYIDEASASVRKHFYCEQTGDFCEGVQGANALAIDAGLATDGRTLENLCEKYSALGTFDTGFLTTDILVDVLVENGAGALAHRLLTTEALGSYLWMKRHGATTIYEYLNGAGSHSHPMFGAPVRQLFSGFAGIKQSPGKEGCGYKNAIISPFFPKGLNYLSASLKTVNGIIGVEWRREREKIALKISIPDGVDAVFVDSTRKIKLEHGVNELFVPVSDTEQD